MYRFRPNSGPCPLYTPWQGLPDAFTREIRLDLNLYLRDTAYKIIKYNTVNIMNHIMERATIIVDGIVQGVGFRYKVRGRRRVSGSHGLCQESGRRDS